MAPPTYHAPRTVEEALTLLAGDGARVLAGGTDLIVQMRAGRARPEAIVDLKRIPVLSGIRAEVAGFFIGAATPCVELRRNAALAAAWPGVVEAASLIGSVQVRGRASMGGNLCNGSPAADSVPALIAADARALVAGPAGKREVAVADIPAGPGKTTLAPDELLVELRLPPRPARGGDAYLRATPRSEMDIAVAGAAVALVLDGDGVIAAARVALGAVAATARLVPEAGAALIGTRLDGAALARLAEVTRAAAQPISDKRSSAAYRTHMAGVLVMRAAAIAFARAGGEPA